MPTEFKRVNLVAGALALGFALTDAVQRALGMSLSAWGGQYGFKPSEVSMCLRGYENRIYGEIRDRLAGDLDTTREVVDGWIDAQRAVKAAA